MNKSVKAGKEILMSCMARNLAHKLNPARNGSSGSKTREDGNKELLNRREYMKLGVAAAATAMGAGASLTGASSETTDTFTTDFSEYSS